MADNSLSTLEKRLKYSFNNISLLKKALTHSSVSATENYQKLEFLGDSLLDFVVADYLLGEYPSFNEGEASKKRAELVGKIALSGLYDKWNLVEYIDIANVKLSGMSEKLKSDFVEAIIGAIYLDSNIHSARSFIVENVCNSDSSIVDYKSGLLEFAAKNKRKISFDFSESGPDHNKTFSVRLTYDESQSWQGQGKTKIEAEQSASKSAWEALGLCTK